MLPYFDAIKDAMKLRTLAHRTFSIFLCFALANLAVPESPLLAIGKPIKDAIARKWAADAEARRDMAKRRSASKTRALSQKEMDTLQGRTAQCPYLAGASKWDPNFQGVDLVTGNYSTSATDLSFDGGYGIPVNITRSYSANDANEGPFGRGWTLSADVRTTAGGILKSKSAPVRSVPVTYKERSAAEVDPNVSAQPVEAVTAEDSSGKQETIQKDADGVLTPAAWDQNQTVSTYQSVVVGTSVYQILSAQTMTTPDGTTYVYQAEGSYTNGGTVPYGNPTATPTPSNILKIVSATDRNGNVTTYSYGGTAVSFSKIDGTTSEYPLTGVQMPNGHTITLTWGNGTTGPTNRVVKINDNNSARVIYYTYDTGGNLHTVTSAAGLITTYGYSSPVNEIPGSTDTSNPVLSSITDPRGMTTQISSFIGVGTLLPYNAQVESVLTYLITGANGVTTEYHYGLDYQIEPIPNASTPVPTNYEGYYAEHAGGLSAQVIATDGISGVVSGSSLQIYQLQHVPLGAINDLTPYDVFDVWTQNCLQSTSYWYPSAGTYANWSNLNTSVARQLSNNPDLLQEATSTTNYNFQGKPLDVTVAEATTQSVTTTTRTATTSYAYWDASKYYQQKAVKDPGGRMSFTDYYTSSDSNLGNRGQTYQVWDAKYGGVALNTSITPPAGTLAQDAWRYQVQATTGQNAAQFTYDSKGRATTVYKLQAATAGTPSTYRYVTTQTTYGADTDGSWGQASQVVEDSGGINRTTRTLGYTSWGKADDVVDAAGHEFQTSYDGDGKVLSVTQVGVGAIATYTYGGSGVTNGQVLSVADNLSGVTQTLAYQTASGGGLGQVASVTETRSGTVDNVAAYTYDGAGNRATVTYRDGSNNILAQWGYYNYICVGAPAKPSFVFQTLCKLDGSGNRTSEEFHYAYDSVGHVLEATFAQTPSNNTPDANGYYDGHLAANRARAHYEYDAGGRLTWLAHYWDTLNSGGTAYTSEAILAQGADYEVNTGLNRGLKLDSKYYTRTTPGQANWTLAQTDSYSYDPQLDYLTGASYGDGQANATPTWSYDAAGNRNDVVTDNLNRATSLNGVSATNDVLGNRLTMGSNTYGWDALNRMTSFSNGTISTSYTYRADGMRTYKSNSNGATSYRYDGQMGMEDIDYLAGNVQKVTDYGLGARGVDAMYVTQSGTTSSVYPIYDGHGNMISTLARSGSAGYSFTTLRTFDAWGNIRLGASTGDPKGRYCANLGHKQDDESGLTYMRARYYEPASGRFISQDRKQDGANWFCYARNCPIDCADTSGRDTDWLQWAAGFIAFQASAVGLTLLLVGLFECCSAKTPAEFIDGLELSQGGVILTGVAAGFLPKGNPLVNGALGLPAAAGGIVLQRFLDEVKAIDAEAAVGCKTEACAAVLACAVYAITIMSIVISED